jgi:hypothetical protein
MRQPFAPGTEVSSARLGSWLNRFRFYRQPPDEAAVRSWIASFRVGDRDVAARILDCVEVVSEPEIHDGYRIALRGLPGWSADVTARQGRWFFLGFGGPSESGQVMLRMFREANRLTGAANNSLFCNLSDLPSKMLTAEDNVVFVDDFSGTGNQVVRMWPTIQELAAAEAKYYLIITAATRNAIDRIAAETGLTLISRTTLECDDNVFDTRCSYFSDADRQTIERYGKRADRQRPKGYGDCGLLFVLCHKTPNNTLPILHANHDKWRGLFPRYL